MAHTHDLVIRGGTIIDGSGAARFTGDIAIDGGRISAHGPYRHPRLCRHPHPL